MIKTEKYSNGPQHAANVAQQSAGGGFSCSSEQSKLCLCPTESLLTDKKQPASLTVEGFPPKSEKPMGSQKQLKK